VRRLDRIEGSTAKLSRSLALSAGLRVSGVPHVRGDDRLQRLRRQPGCKLGEKPLKGRSAEWKKAAVIASENDLHPIEEKLEVDGAAGALCLMAELPTLHVNAHQEPTHDPDDRADDARDDSI